MKKWMMAVTVVVSIAVFFGCGTYDAYPPSGEDDIGGGFPAVSDGAAYEENYRYDSVEEQGFVLRENAPLCGVFARPQYRGVFLCPAADQRWNDDRRPIPCA